MNQRYTLIMLLLAVALGTFAWMQRDAEPVDFTDGGPTPTPAPLFEMAAADIQEVEVQSPEGDHTYVRVAGGWEIDEQTLSEIVDGTIGRIANPSVLRYLPEDRNADEYGFDSPTMTVTFKTSAGEAKTLIVGDKNPVEMQYYVRQSDDPRIAIVEDNGWSSFLSWASQPPFAATPTPEAVEELPAMDDDEAADAETDDAEAVDDEADDAGAGDDTLGDEEASDDASGDDEAGGDAAGGDEAGGDEAGDDASDG